MGIIAFMASSDLFIAPEFTRVILELSYFNLKINKIIACIKTELC